MNWVDWIWSFAVLAGVISGLRSGALSELLRILGWVLITGVTLRFAPIIQWQTLLMLVAGLLAVAWIIRKLVCLITGKPGLLSRFIGSFLGAARMAALMILLTLGVARLQSQMWYRPVCEESRCGATVMLWFSNTPATNQIQQTI